MTGLIRKVQFSWYALPDLAARATIGLIRTRWRSSAGLARAAKTMIGKAILRRTVRAAIAIRWKLSNVHLIKASGVRTRQWGHTALVWPRVPPMTAEAKARNMEARVQVWPRPSSQEAEVLVKVLRNHYLSRTKLNILAPKDAESNLLTRRMNLRQVKR